jgi:hypothetical protein
VLGTAFAGSEPNTISLNEDGTKLYVGFRTSSTVSRFSVPALTRDFTVPLPLHSPGSTRVIRIFRSILPRRPAHRRNSLSRCMLRSSYNPTASSWCSTAQPCCQLR